MLLAVAALALVPPPLVVQPPPLLQPPLLQPTMLQPTMRPIMARFAPPLHMSAAEGASKKGRLLPLAAAAALTAASFSVAAPSKTIAARVLAGTTVSVLPGLVDPHLAVSFGYGASMLWCAILFANQPVARLLALPYALYGLKVCIFQAARDMDTEYVARALAPSRKKSPRGLQSWVKRLPLVASVSVLLSCFCLPLHAASAAGVGARRGVACGALIALGGLLLQTVADFQKFRFKTRFGADSLMRFGLFAYSRHPNYLGEVIFQLGVLLGGVSAAASLRSACAAWLSALAPLAFIGIMFGATERLERSQLDAYGADLDYREWVKRTPRMFFGGDALALRYEGTMRGGGASGGGVGGLAVDAVARDEARASVYDAEEQEELGQDIYNIFYVTGLAGVATAVTGVLGAYVMFGI